MSPHRSPCLCGADGLSLWINPEAEHCKAKTLLYPLFSPLSLCLLKEIQTSLYIFSSKDQPKLIQCSSHMVRAYWGNQNEIQHYPKKATTLKFMQLALSLSSNHLKAYPICFCLYLTHVRFVTGFSVSARIEAE